MNKKLLIITFIFIMPRAHSQQLSPVQLQKVKLDFDTAIKAKKFDDAQIYLKQMEQGGRRAEAQKLAADLANARQKETEAQKLTELHKAHKAEADRVMATRETEKYKKEIEQLEKSKKQLGNKKKEHEELSKQLKRAEEEIHKSYDEQRAQMMEMRKLKQQHRKEIEQLKQQAQKAQK